MDQCGSASTLETPEQKLLFTLILNKNYIYKKIQVFGLLAYLSSYITIFTLDTY